MAVLSANKPRATSVLLAGLLALLAGCEAQAQNIRLLKEWQLKCKAAADLLAGVKDVPSAKAAEPRLAKLLSDMDKIQEQLDRTYEPSEVEPADERAVTKQVGEGIVQMQRLVVETMRIGKEPQLTQALGETWERLPSKGLLDATDVDLQSP